jgi:hypothetical protein
VAGVDGKSLPRTVARRELCARDWVSEKLVHALRHYLASGEQTGLRGGFDSTDGVGARVSLRPRTRATEMRDTKRSGRCRPRKEALADFGLGAWPSVASITAQRPYATHSSLAGLALNAGRYTIERASQ